MCLYKSAVQWVVLNGRANQEEGRGAVCCDRFLTSWHPFLPKTLKMGQTSVPETLVIHKKLTPGYNPKTFKQHYEHGGSLQLHIAVHLSGGI